MNKKRFRYMYMIFQNKIYIYIYTQYNKYSQEKISLNIETKIYRAYLEKKFFIMFIYIYILTFKIIIIDIIEVFFS